MFNEKWNVESGKWKCAVIHNVTNNQLHANIIKATKSIKLINMRVEKQC